VNKWESETVMRKAGERFSEWVHAADWTAICLALLVGGTLCVLSVRRYVAYNAGMLDLGNMSQAIWSATQGHPLEYTHEDGTFSRLAWHVEVIYFLLTPLYALVPDPRTLLVVQAVLFTLGAWPAYRLAHRHLEDGAAARALMLVYLCLPVSQTAVLFDFHGDTLAMPLLMFALEALDGGAYRRYSAALGLALLCKMYVAVPVVVLGAFLWIQRRTRVVGLATMVAAIGWGLIAFRVIGPHFAPQGSWQAHTDMVRYIRFYFGQALSIVGPTAVQRLANALVVFAPVLWLGRPALVWGLPAVAVAIPALLSGGDVVGYDYRFHHYALTVPFLFMAVLMGATRLRQTEQQGGTLSSQRGPSWRAEVMFTLAVVLVFNIGLVDWPLNPRFWLAPPGVGLHEWRYGRTARDAVKDTWLAQYVPAGAPIAASEYLAPHLANRRVLWLVRYPDELKALGQPDHVAQSVYLMRHPEKLDTLLLSQHLSDVDYVIADALFDHGMFFGRHGDYMTGGVLYDVPGIMVVLESPAFQVAQFRDGLLLFSREDLVKHPLAMTLEHLEPVLDPMDSSIQADFGGALGLLSANVKWEGGRRFLLEYEWVALRDLRATDPMVAVSRLNGVVDSRIVHLPTLARYPTIRWLVGEHVREAFEVVLPASTSPGQYALSVGWYNGAHPFASETDSRSRIGHEVVVAYLTVP